MDLEKKIKLQQNIIKDLTNEKNVLLKKVEELEFELNSEREFHKNSLNEAKKLIQSCSTSKQIYDKAINELIALKSHYEESLNEINIIKSNYNKEINEIIKRFNKKLK